MNERGEPQIFNIKKATCYVNGVPMTGVSPDGFGITPAGESSVIEGLTSEVGFNVDTATKAEGSLSLNASSPENATLRNLINLMREGSQGPVEFRIQVTDANYENAFGFKKRGMHFAWIQGFPEYKTDKRNAPVFVYKFVGYGYFEE